METNPRFKISSDGLEKRGIKSATCGLVVIRIKRFFFEKQQYKNNDLEERATSPCIFRQPLVLAVTHILRERKISCLAEMDSEILLFILYRDTQLSSCSWLLVTAQIYIS